MNRQQEFRPSLFITVETTVVVVVFGAFLIHVFLRYIEMYDRPSSVQTIYNICTGKQHIPEEYTDNNFDLLGDTMM